MGKRKREAKGGYRDGFYSGFDSSLLPNLAPKMNGFPVIVVGELFFESSSGLYYKTIYDRKFYARSTIVAIYDASVVILNKNFSWYSH